MARDLRDVVNKIIIAVGEDEATSEEIAGLASDIATFFDASVVLVYVGKLPISFPPGEGVTGYRYVAEAANIIETNAQRTLDRMAEVLTAHSVPVTSKLIMGAEEHAMREIIEQEKGDLLILPQWRSGVTERLIRVFSPSMLEDAPCPVLVLKGNRWLSESKSARPGIPGSAADRPVQDAKQSDEASD